MSRQSSATKCRQSDHNVSSVAKPTLDAYVFKTCLTTPNIASRISPPPPHLPWKDVHSRQLHPRQHQLYLTAALISGKQWRQQDYPTHYSRHQ